MAMKNHFVALGFVLAALAFALDAGLAAIAIGRLAHSGGHAVSYHASGLRQ
jgi:hypothetical protein